MNVSRRRAFNWQWVRILAVILFALGCGLLVHRIRSAPDNSALEELVTERLPRIVKSEEALRAQVNRLSVAPGLAPKDARALLVGDVIPGLLSLKTRLSELHRDSPEVAGVIDEYKAAIDQLIDACRTCVRVIDDPKLSQADSVAKVRAQFQRADTALATWDNHVRELCAKQGLTAPRLR